MVALKVEAPTAWAQPRVEAAAGGASETSAPGAAEDEASGAPALASSESELRAGDEGVGAPQRSATAAPAGTELDEEAVRARVEALRDAIAGVDEVEVRVARERELGDRVLGYLQTRLQEEPRSRVALRELSVARVQDAVWVATLESARGAARGWQQEVSGLEALLEEHARAAELDAQERQRLERSERAQEAARQAVEQTRLREEQERDAQIRQVLAREREIAEELLAISEREGEQIREIMEKRRESEATFSERRVEVERGLEQADEDLAPVVRQALEYRRAARADVQRTRELRREAAREVARLRPEREQAHEEIRRLADEVGEEPTTELARRRKALAELRLELASQRLQIAEDVHEARVARHEVNLQRRLFFDESLETLFPRMSAQTRALILSPRSDQAWRDAFAGLRVGVMIAYDTVEVYFDEVRDLRGMLTSVAFWGWVMGVFWRVIAILIALWLGREFGPRVVQWGLSQLLARRALRNTAGALIKVAQVMRALIVPAIVYVSAAHLSEYLSAAIPELLYVRWVIDALVIYYGVMITVKTLVLPRGGESADVVGSAGGGVVAAQTLDSLAQEGAVELTRARRLVRSVRVVLSFWLLSYYVPMTVWELTGPSVIWWLADRVFWVALLVLIYLVLWWWKDDIAEVFERLAGERLPRATALVRERRSRPYGVLLIGLASLYVLGSEIVRWGRAYLVETEISRQVSNFIFRKKIEIQRREGAVVEVPEAAQSTVPERYRAMFEDSPLLDEPFRVQRTGIMEAITAQRGRWESTRRQGSVAIVGEAGIGKTTELLQVVGQWPQERGPIQYCTLAQKVAGEVAALELIAQLFHLPETPANREEAVEWLRRTPPRTIVIDDCHHLFLRHIGGFRAVDLFLDVVHISDDHHFWVLVFNRFAWSYLNRVRARKHYFGQVYEVGPWSEHEIQQLVRARDARIDLPISFTDLVIAHQSGELTYEVIKTANGYFRLLHEFCQGNPRVALTFWLRSLRLDALGRLQVGLFSRPSAAVQQTLTDQYLFALAAIVQHGSLNAEQVARITNAERGFCETAINFLYESDILVVNQRQGRASLSTLYYRAVLRQLRDANFLYE
ncbi:hypothetical protein DL240_06535 [Lujinxingia litoralis]|uniref:ORC1/DEAH AAA+ ATPase domain-containing protein n=2 Tax=Lujinxingia litoralis TaxID=2211119 RepID=A0A328C8Y8_9DELT|nr:hypothetical protein DL240_06535 [Lujinxingia litoralis]